MGSSIKNADADKQSAEATLAPERGPAKEQVGPPSDDSEEEGEASEPESNPQDPANPSLPHEQAPPLPSEANPPLPQEAPPGAAIAPTLEDDGWDPVWDESSHTFYFHNRFTSATQWENPRVPDQPAQPAQPGPPGVASRDREATSSTTAVRPHGGYDPSIHGDYDPTASYALESAAQTQAADPAMQADPAAAYTASGHFNRFTGRWQAAEIKPENYNDESKSKRQMNAFFDADSAANSHRGKSLKAERAGLKLTKQELKAFKEKRKEKKEEKRRAWLRD